MTPTQIRAAFRQLTIWSRGDQRAPHKPLLVLYALGCLQRGEPRLLHYRQVGPNLRALLEEFGPPRQRHHPEYPFWRLRNDGIWEIDDAEKFQVGEAPGDARQHELNLHDARGGLREDVFRSLARNPGLLRDVAEDLLDANFPESLHQDILDAVGLHLSPVAGRRASRDSSFRDRVLSAYQYQCAVCRAALRLGDRTIALDAAHIKWHQAGGPDVERNGLALCVLHHKVFDLGAFMIDFEFRILVSESAHGAHGFDEWLGAFHALPIAMPLSKDSLPDKEFLGWHRSQVFHAPARDAGR